MAQNKAIVAGLGTLALAVGTLYGLVLAGVPSPLASLRAAGLPVGLERHLSADERGSANGLETAFGRIGYRLDNVARNGQVPPLFLSAVPDDLDQMPEIDAKKRVFLRLMLPLVLVVNEEIAEDRRRLQAMADGRVPHDPAWLAELAARYRAEGASPAQLLRKVDVVPPSLALAQAAEESGWGTSRFVRKANNLFGHVGSTVTPKGDTAGPRMAAFATLHEAVRAYVHNLNTHPAYEGLRRARATARARGAAPDGATLAGSLSRYSERGEAYVDTIRLLIRGNRLDRFDHARIGGGHPAGMHADGSRES